jgi:dihydroneopterin aldolase
LPSTESAGRSSQRKGKILRQEELLDSFALLEDAHLGMKGAPEHQIHIEQLEIFARVGVPEGERAKSQRLSVSVTLWPTRDTRELDDKIGRSVDYSDVCKEVKKFARNRSDKLIETLADGIAAHLLKSFPIRKIAIELRKFVLLDAAYASVVVTRAAPLKRARPRLRR